MTAVLDAVRRGLDHLPGGRPVVAVRLGKTDEVARKELAGHASHKLGALDALAIARLCVEAGTPHCYDYAAMVAEECGGEFKPHAERMDARLQVMQRVTACLRTSGEATSTAIEILADGDVTDSECAAAMQAIAEAEEANRRLRQAILAAHAASKARAPLGEPPMRANAFPEVAAR